MGYHFSIIFYIQTLPVRILFPTKPVYKLHKWYHTHKNKSEMYDQISPRDAYFHENWIKEFL